jgi:replicative DNA helicase
MADPAPSITESAAGLVPGGSKKIGRGKSQPAAVDPVRALPASEEAEKGALCCMMVDPEGCLGNVLGKLKPEAFLNPAHREIFSAISALKDQRMHLDLVTLTAHLHNIGKLNEVGGAAYLGELMDYVPTTALFEQYVEILEDKRVLRSIIASCTRCVTRAHDEQGDVKGLLDEVEKDILDIRQSDTKNTVRTLKGEVLEAVGGLNKMMSSNGGLSGLSTGFKDFDTMTDGLHASEMIVIAARPSMGKTSLVMNIVEHVACDMDKAALVFSLEMSSQQLVQRLICARAGVSLKRIRDGYANKADFARIMSTGKELAEKKLFIDDTPSISIIELRAKARRVHSQQPLSLVAIDYLQLMRSTSKRAQDNRQQEISEISSGIKALAKELKIPVIVLAQLNRNPEQREGGKPRLSDLRESGSIEQDADLVGLLVRDAYYAKDQEDREEKGNKAELVIAKQRNGPTGDVPLVFLGELMRFRDRARDDNEPG